MAETVAGQTAHTPGAKKVAQPIAAPTETAHEGGSGSDASICATQFMGGSQAVVPHRIQLTQSVNNDGHLAL